MKQRLDSRINFLKAAVATLLFSHIKVCHSCCHLQFSGEDKLTASPNFMKSTSHGEAGEEKKNLIRLLKSHSLLEPLDEKIDNTFCPQPPNLPERRRLWHFTKC